MKKNRNKKIKKYTLKQAMQTVTGRILLLIATMVIPVNLISLFFLNANYLNTRHRVESEIDDSLNQASSNLQSELMTMKKRMLYNTFVMNEIVELKEKEILDSTRRYNNISQISSELKKMQIVQKQIKMVYYYFEPSDLFVAYGDIGISYSSKDKLIHELHSDPLDETSLWRVMEMDGIPMLVNTNRLHGMDYGMLLQLNMTSSYFDEFTENEDRTFFLGNEDGTVLSQDGVEFLKSKGLSFSDLENSRRYYLAKSAVKTSGLYLYEAISYREIDGIAGYTGRIILLLLGLFTIAVIPMLIFFIKRLVINPLENLNDAMDIIESGDPEYRLTEEVRGVEFQHIHQNFNAMLDQLENLKIEMYEKDIAEKDVRLAYLSHQIQPHFILNALNILYSYEPEEYALSQKMIMCISKYFRHIVYANDKFVSLKSEMDHVANYFEIQKARFPDLFYSIVEYDEDLAEALIPPLVIQTFAENSIKHSLKIGNRITIYLIAEKHMNADGEDMIRIRLADTGEGISDEIIREIDAFMETGEYQEHLGVGIQNTIERFRVIYHDRASLRFWRDPNYQGTNVEIMLPLHYKGENIEHEKF